MLKRRIAMNKRIFLFSRYRLAVQGLALGVTLLVCAPAGAQNLLGNPSFESPLGVGTTNWTIHYISGAADDWDIKDRTTSAVTNRPAQYNDRGIHFRPATQRFAHAYYSQTVTNLEVGHSYTIGGWMWAESPGFGNAPITYRVYFEAIGGQGTDGVVRSPDGPYSDAGSGDVFQITQTPDANGNIEVRLHCEKFRFCNYDKLVLMNGYFDRFCLSR